MDVLLYCNNLLQSLSSCSTHAAVLFWIVLSELDCFDIQLLLLQLHLLPWLSLHYHPDMIRTAMQNEHILIWQLRQFVDGQLPLISGYYLACNFDLPT